MATHNRITRRHLLGAFMAATAASCVRGKTVVARRRDDSGPTNRLKTIGVLGGIGPQATMDFEVRVHSAAQRLLPQRENSGHPPMLVYYHREPPFVMNEDRSPRIPFEAHPRLIDAARRFGSWADFLVITSNGPHLVAEQLADAAGRPVLSMIDVTLREVRRRQWRRVGVLGFGNPNVYSSPLRESNVTPETLDSSRRAALDGEIIKVMEGRDDASSTDVAREAVMALRARGVDGIVVGCTEIPLLLGNVRGDADLIDPAELLAEAAVRHASA